MLRLNKSYRVFQGKVTTSGNRTTLKFSESTKDPKTGEWHTDAWWEVCVSGEYPCDRNDGVKFTPTAFTAVSQREYNGKKYYTVFADGTIEYKGNTYTCGDKVDFSLKDSGAEVVGMTEDLPF